MEINYDELLKNVVKSRVWTMTKKFLSRVLGAEPLWLVNKKGELLVEKKPDRAYCRLIKDTPTGERECQKSLQLFLNQVKANKNPTIYTCHAGFLGFICPLIVKEELIGLIGACQIVASNLSESDYRETAKKFSLNSPLFLSAIQESPSIQSEILELNVELIFSLIELYFASVVMQQELRVKDDEVESIAEFYRMFEESRKLILTLEPQKLYPLIVNLTAKAMKAEICSLMLIDQKSQEITIKAAVGLDEQLIGKTHLMVGKGVVGYVAKTGEPLLVKDITEDTRFQAKESLPRYYTKSLISAPLKIGDEVIGVINVNNMRTRKPFTERDLKFLSIICGHAAIALKNARGAHSEEKEKIDQEIEHYAQEKIKITKAKEELIKEKTQIEINLQQKEELIKVKEELIRVKQELIREKEKSVGEEEEVFALKKEMSQLEREREELLKERIELLKKAQSTEVLIREKENLEKEKEKLIQEKEELEVQTEELGLLYSISRETPLMSLPQEILSWVLNKIQHFFNFHAGAFLLLDNDRLISEIKQVCYINDECLQDIKTRLEKGWVEIAGTERLKRVSYYTQEDGGNDMFWVGVERFQSYLQVPLSHREEVIGLLAISSFNENAFTPLQRRLLTIVSNQVSITLEKVRLFAKVKEMAERDELTKVYNYRYFEDYLSKEFNFAYQYKKPISLLMLDFDRLKFVNDTYGHQAGNLLIRTISDIMLKTIGDKGVLARFGGDEFSAILPETDQNSAFALAEAVRVNIAKRSIEFQKGNPHQLSASLGVATYPMEGINNEKDLLSKADKALYEAKQRGRNCVVPYRP